MYEWIFHLQAKNAANILTGLQIMGGWTTNSKTKQNPPKKELGYEQKWQHDFVILKQQLGAWL